ncbi:hypothetical protein PR048_022000, partial [Dryococelus australis]
MVNNFVFLPDDYDFIYMSTPLVSYKEVADITSKDLILSKVLETVMNGNFKRLRNEPELRKYFKIYKLLSIPEDSLISNSWSIENKMSIIHADHVGITRCKLMERSYVWWFVMNDDRDD